MVITLFGRPAVRRSNRTRFRTVPPSFLNDSQWFLIEDLFPHPPITSLGGRPRVLSLECLEGILWVLQTGARWKDLPERYPSPAICWRCLRDWTEAGIWLIAWMRLLSQLDEFKDIN